jgi:hypothetical protein
MKTSRVMKCFRVFPLIVVLMLQGFGGSISAEAATKKPAAKKTTTSNPWKCEESEDGLGAKVGCQNDVIDKYNYRYKLTLMCTSEQKLAHSILVFEPDMNLVNWGDQTSTKIRIDSKPLETWATGTKGGGQALLYEKGTKFLLTKIATAKTFGFSARDEEGQFYSARFNVQNSVPIAAKFAAMGCKTELK